MAVGCMSPFAGAAFDPGATLHSADACDYRGVQGRLGCRAPGVQNYLDQRLSRQPLCVAPRPGCRAPGATNFDSLANLQADRSCSYPRRGCTSSASSNFASSADTDDGSCRQWTPTTDTDDRLSSHRAIEGCMSPWAANWRPAATVH
eukprot:5752266-Prymnesium_polylepis.1